LFVNRQLDDIAALGIHLLVHSNERLKSTAQMNQTPGHSPRLRDYDALLLPSVIRSVTFAQQRAGHTTDFTPTRSEYAFAFVPAVTGKDLLRGGIR